MYFDFQVIFKCVFFPQKLFSINVLLSAKRGECSLDMLNTNIWKFLLLSVRSNQNTANRSF